MKYKIVNCKDLLYHTITIDVEWNKLDCLMSDFTYADLPSIYSWVRNKYAGTFINFQAFFQVAHSYFITVFVFISIFWPKSTKNYAFKDEYALSRPRKSQSEIIGLLTAWEYLCLFLGLDCCFIVVLYFTSPRAIVSELFYRFKW